MENEQASVLEKKRFLNKKFLLLSIVFIAVFISAVFLLFQSSFFQEKNLLLAKVDSKLIYRNDILKEYRMRYPTDNIQKYTEIKKDAARKLLVAQVSKTIIEDEAKKLGITVEKNEVDEYIEGRIKTGLAGEFFADTLAQDDIKLLLFKKKLGEKMVSWRKIELANIFVPEGPGLELRASNARLLLNEFREDVILGNTFQEAYDKAFAKNYFNKGLRISTDIIKRGDNFDKSIIDTAFRLKVGEVSDIIDSGGGTLFVAKLIDQNEGGYESFEDWLKKQVDKIQIQNL